MDIQHYFKNSVFLFSGGFYSVAEFEVVLVGHVAFHIAIEHGNAPFTGSFRPKVGNSLSVFDGLDAFGQWRLQIDDLYHDDKGSLENFELIITVPEPATFMLFALSGCLLRRRN